MSRDLAWHIKLIDRMISVNKKATIKDYFRLTKGYNWMLFDEKITIAEYSRLTTTAPLAEFKMR